MAEPSRRIIDQRVRNRIIEALAILSEGDAGVLAVGATEYFENYYDHVPHRDDGELYPNGAISAEERSAIREVSKILDAACDETRRELTEGQLIESGWPRRIQVVAKRALDLMDARGRFCEGQEEAVPSMRGPAA